MAGLVPPARRKPLRRGEGLGINVFPSMPNDLDGRNKPGHDDVEAKGHTRPNVLVRLPCGVLDARLCLHDGGGCGRQAAPHRPPGYFFPLFVAWECEWLWLLL